MRLKTVLLASAAGAAVLAVVSPVQAGSYVSVLGGWNTTDDIKSRAGSLGSATFTQALTHTVTTTITEVLTFSLPTTFFNSGAKAEDGFIVGAAVGGDLGHWLQGLRGEFELSYRRNSLGGGVASAAASGTATASADFGATGNYSHDCVITPQAPATVVVGPPGPCVAGIPATGVHSFTGFFSTTNSFASSGGSVRTFALMANVWYDFNNMGGFTPYIGGGVGYADNKVQNGLLLNGANGGFAWQLGAGANYALSDKTSIGIGYRYMDAGDVTLIRSPGVAAGNKLIADDHDVTHQSVLVNLTFAIGK